MRAAYFTGLPKLLLAAGHHWLLPRKQPCSLSRSQLCSLSCSQGRVGVGLLLTFQAKASPPSNLPLQAGGGAKPVARKLLFIAQEQRGAGSR
jgi:hypothetical protein